MSIFVVFRGRADKPDLGDECLGYFENDQEDFAKEYCKTRNLLAGKGESYWYETVAKLR